MGWKGHQSSSVSSGRNTSHQPRLSKSPPGTLQGWGGWCRSHEWPGEVPYPGVGWHQRVRAHGRGPVGGEGLRFGDQGVISFVVDSGVDKATVHAPGAVSCGNTQLLDPAPSSTPAPRPPKPHQARKTL